VFVVSRGVQEIKAELNIAGYNVIGRFRMRNCE
jgi:hypothetical protein